MEGFSVRKPYGKALAEIILAMTPPVRRGESNALRLERGLQRIPEDTDLLQAKRVIEAKGRQARRRIPRSVKHAFHVVSVESITYERHGSRPFGVANLTGPEFWFSVQETLIHQRFEGD